MTTANPPIHYKIHNHQSKQPIDQFLLLSTRGGGGAPRKSTTNAVIGPNNKSPFGLPGIVSPKVYELIDVLPFFCFLVGMTIYTSGTARTMFVTVGIIHTILPLVTVYDTSKGSILQQMFNINSIGIPFKTMYWYDVLGGAIMTYLTTIVNDGYTPTTKLFARCLFLGGIPLQLVSNVS